MDHAMKPKPKKTRPYYGGGRKAEGRETRSVMLLPGVWKRIERHRKVAGLTSIGKAIEELLEKK